jgi:hypothetical protein
MSSLENEIDPALARIAKVQAATDRLTSRLQPLLQEYAALHMISNELPEKRSYYGRRKDLLGQIVRMLKEENIAGE